MLVAKDFRVISIYRQESRLHDYVIMEGQFLKTENNLSVILLFKAIRIILNEPSYKF